MTRHLLFIFCFIVCAVSQGQHAFAQEDSISERVFIIGDAGKLLDKKSIVPNALATIVKKNDRNTTILFVGDNIYPKGLPGEDDKDYDKSVEIITKQLKPFYDYKAAVYVIPGNHDWQKGGPMGWERIKRQAKFVNDLQQPNIHFLPLDGCPGPEEVQVGDSLVVIIMDTQWWLHPYEKPGEQSDCACKNPDEVLVKLHDIAYRNRNKKIIFASHQPFQSHGIHGGYYTWKQHIFPFTDLKKNLYIPLPVIGSIYPIVRGGFGNVQDLKNPVYKDMSRSMQQALSVAPDITYVGGHDHALQLIHDKGHNYIVSGSGINRERVKKAKNTLFASGNWGFAEIQYLKNGTRRILFYEVDENARPTLAYSNVFPAVAYTATNVATGSNTTTTHEMVYADSIVAAIAPEYDNVGKAHRFFWGEAYRKVWATPVKMKVFHISEEKGGMTVLQKGGGKQTKSLRLKDVSGKEWVLRTVQKDPEKALPEGLRKTVAQDIVQDQISAANPYAPLTVPIMAEQLGIPHAEPQIVYVPDDPGLGIYRGDFANTVCVFEEREPGAGDNTKTYSTPKVLEKLEEDNDNSIDEKAVLKARMFDLLIADWDRHEDQWRWGKREEDGRDVYYPIPRDRDQVYFLNTGVMPWIAARKWLVPKFQGFKPYIPDVNGEMFNARYFDRYFLRQLNEDDWKEVIASVQNTMTDSLIKAAVRQLPDSVFKQYGQMTINYLTGRRNVLMQEGLKFYRFLSKDVDVTGSDKRELFSIEHKDDGDVQLTVYKIKKDGDKGHVLYQRNFEKGVTREIRLYGRGGKDVFEVTGDTRSKIKVRMIGGGGADSFYVNPGLKNKNKLVVYDRSDKNNVYPPAHLADIRTSEKSSVNEFNGRAFKYDILAPQATAGYNLDDGMLLGIGFKYTKQGFRKEPYAQQHTLMIGHALATDASLLRYTGDFKKLIGQNDLNIVVNAKAPDNTSNFFGVGNESQFIREGDNAIRYYRTRYNLIQTQVNLQRPLSKSFKVFAGLVGQYFKMDKADNDGRYINVYQSEHPDNNLFTGKFYTGLNVGYEIDTRNDDMMPTRGFYWHTILAGMRQLNEKENTTGTLATDMRFFISFNKDPRVVIANRIGGGVLIGDPQFYQYLYLGGKENLSGFRSYRFAGTSMLYYNLELRIKLFDFTSYLFPGSVGMSLFNDVGRVWVKEEASGVWHDGYGFGLYVTPAKMILINATLGFSNEGTYPYFRIGYRF